MSAADAPRSQSTVQIDNSVTRVSESRFAPGATTGFHRHEHDYVVVPLTTGTLTIIAPSGQSTAELVTGQVYFRNAGVEHEVVNTNNFEFVFVEIEMKREASSE